MEENFEEEFKVKRRVSTKPNKNIFLRIVIFLILIIVSIFVIGIFWYKNGLKHKKGIDDKTYFEIKENSTIKDLGETLKEKGIIRSEKAFNIYTKLNNFNLINIGRYEAKKEQNLGEILDMVKNGKIYDSSINIRIPEGITIEDLAKKVAKETKISEQEMLDTLRDKEYIQSLCEKYWFMDEKEIFKKGLREPLEGYIFPDTYKFDKETINPKQIIEMSLIEMDKVLTEQKARIKEMTFNVHDILTLASIIEKETTQNSDRQEVAGLFINRLNLNMSLGSDPTAHYEFKVPFTKELSMKEINTKGKYNTRGPEMEGKLPIGPIATVSKSSINSVLYYKKTDNVYFVSDKNGKIYFTKTLEEHEALVKKLKENNMWHTY